MTSGSPHDFDFIFGSWRVEHRRLTARLADCESWEEFDGTCTARPILDGLGNVDDNVVNLPSGSYRAASVRSFDAATGTWAIWWLDGRNPHIIDVPVVGGFENGNGAFYANEVFNGKPIVVRFRWHDTDKPVPRWDQAFSPDDGQTWELNWKMNFIALDAVD
jgi:hypothetical protein